MTYKGHEYHRTDVATTIRVERGQRLVEQIAYLYDIDIKPHGSRPFLTSIQQVKDFIDGYIDDPLSQSRTIGKPTPRRILSARRSAGMTQRELGEAIGYTGATAGRMVQHFEQGTRPVPMGKITVLADTLKMPIRELLP